MNKPGLTTVCRVCGTTFATAGDGFGEVCVGCLLDAALTGGNAPESAASVDAVPPPPGGLELHGTCFAHYEISTRADGAFVELGRGAMGVTYRAVDTVLHHEVALKVVAPEVAGNPQARARFLREAQASASLRHPHVASVFFFGERPTDRQLFYAMELIEGETLQARVARAGGLPADTVLEIGMQVADALAAAEARGLIHRDLKPANLMLVEGESVNVKVIDFGLAKAVFGGSDAAVQQTRAGEFVGTPAFASPEHFNVWQDTDARSDFYALGATLWYALTGKPPFAGRTPEEVRDQQLHAALPVEQLRSVRAPQAVQDFLYSLLSTAPEGRPQTARELAEALAGCAPSPVRRINRELRKTRAWLGYGLAAGVILLLLGAGLLMALRERTTAVTRQAAVLQQRTLAQQQQLTALQSRLEQQTQLIALVTAKIDRHAASAENGSSLPVAAQTEVARARGISVATLKEQLEGENADVRQILVQVNQRLAVAQALAGEWQGLKRETLTRLGDGEYAAGHYPAAIEPYKEALACVDEQKDPLAWCDAARNLEITLRQAGRYPEAMSLAQKVVDRRTALQGAEHPDTLQAIYHQAFLFHAEGNLAKAETLYRQVLDAHARKHTPESLEAMDVATDLCSLLQERGKRAESEAVGRHALEVCERTLGKDDPATLRVLNNLAVTLYHAAKYPEAEALCRRCLEARTRVLGPDHPQTINTENNLALVLHDERAFVESEALYRRALAADERVIGPDHPLTLTVVNNLAVLLQDKGDNAGAEPLQRRVVDGWTRALGPEHPKTLLAINNLAIVRLNEGDAAGAAAIERGCLETQERVLGRDHPAVLNSVSNLAQMLDAKGDIGAAEPLYERAEADMTRLLPTPDPVRMDLEHNFSLLREKQDRFPEALALAEQAADGCKDLPENSPVRHLYEQHLQSLQTRAVAATSRSPGPVDAPIAR